MENEPITEQRPQTLADEIETLYLSTVSAVVEIDRKRLNQPDQLNNVFRKDFWPSFLGLFMITRSPLSQIDDYQPLVKKVKNWRDRLRKDPLTDNLINEGLDLFDEYADAIMIKTYVRVV